MKQYIEKNGIKYELRGEQYYPILEIAPQNDKPIGKYGQMWLDFLKKHRRGIYTTLLTEGALSAHLSAIDQEARSQVEFLTAELTKQRGIDKSLKVTNHRIFLYYVHSQKQYVLFLVHIICYNMIAR